MRMTLKLGFGRQFFLNISSSLVRIKLKYQNQPPSLLKAGDGYEEDLKIQIWKMTSTKFEIFSKYFSQLGQNQVTYQKSASQFWLFIEMVMKKTFKQDLEDDLNNISNLFSILLLVWFESSYMLKISLLACLILQMAMKKTLKSEFERRPQHNSNFFLIISFSQVRVKSHTENQPPTLVILYFPRWSGLVARGN